MGFFIVLAIVGVPLFTLAFIIMIKDAKKEKEQQKEQQLQAA